MAIPANWRRAFDMLPHLAACAKERRTITYKELGALIDYPAFYLGGPLDVLRDEILLRHNLPRIDALVVNQNTHEVGDKFYADGRGDLDAATFEQLLADERERVYCFDRWDEVIQRLREHYLVH